MEQEKNLSGLINSISENVTSLVRGHIELAKAEALAAAKNALKSSILLMIALAIINLGVIFLFIAGAFWVSEAFDFPTSVGFLIIGGSLILLALLFVVIALVKLKSIKDSRRTIDSLNATSESLRAMLPGNK